MRVSGAARPQLRFKRHRVFMAGVAAAPVASALVTLFMLLIVTASTFPALVNLEGLLAFMTSFLMGSLIGTVIALPVCLVVTLIATLVAERLQRTTPSDARLVGAVVGGIIAVLLFAYILIGSSWDTAAHPSPGQDKPLALLELIGLGAVCLLLLPKGVILAHVARWVMGSPIHRA